MSESGQSGRGKRGPRRPWQADNGRDNNSGDKRYSRNNPKPTRDSSQRDNSHRDNSHRDDQRRDNQQRDSQRRDNRGWTPRDRSAQGSADRPGRDNDRRSQNWAGRDDRRSGRDNWTPRDNDRGSGHRPMRGDDRDPGRRDGSRAPRDDNRRTGGRDSAGWPRRADDRRSGGRDNRRFGSRDARDDDRRSGGWTQRDRSGDEGQRRRNPNWSNKDRTGNPRRDNQSRPRRFEDKRDRPAPPPAEPEVSETKVDQPAAQPHESEPKPTRSGLDQPGDQLADETPSDRPVPQELEPEPREPLSQPTDDQAPTADHVPALRESDQGQPGRPELPEEASLSMLDPDIRAELRTLPRNLAEIVGRHLAATGLLIDDDPELALQHARFARTRAARIAVVREAVGLAAYHAGEWAEALSELRAARRMSNGPGHIAVMADCERALGRPERALELARGARDLPPDQAIELKIVAAGARRDMGQLDAAVVALQVPELDPNRGEPWTARLCYAYADNLAAAGRTEEAIRWFLNAAQADDDGDTDAAERAIELSHPDGVQPILDDIS